jgi:hypothetical protein
MEHAPYKSPSLSSSSQIKKIRQRQRQKHMSLTSVPSSWYLFVRMLILHCGISTTKEKAKELATDKTSFFHNLLWYTKKNWANGYKNSVKYMKLYCIVTR